MRREHWGEDHVCGFHGNITPTSNRNANVGSLQTGGVVDTVTLPVSLVPDNLIPSSQRYSSVSEIPLQFEVFVQALYVQTRFPHIDKAVVSMRCESKYIPVPIENLSVPSNPFLTEQLTCKSWSHPRDRNI